MQNVDVGVDVVVESDFDVDPMLSINLWKEKSELQFSRKLEPG